MYFAQHGLALPKDVDPERPLSADGQGQLERIAAYLESRGIHVTEIYHSGKTRARQSAQILTRHLGDGAVFECSGMNPNDDVVKFAEALGSSDAMYVGHLPHLGKLVSYLVTGDEHSAVVKFTNGGVVCVDRDGESYHIAWYLTPAVCGV
jgi:phosphohistidine phosphatase